MKLLKTMVMAAMLALPTCSIKAEVDPNFYIFICFGQSNMEGAAPIETVDTTDIDERFMVLQSVDCPDLGREKGNWYKAIPPITRCNTGLTPVDYFGRSMIDSLPEHISVGVINVSVGGCRIELFDKDNYKEYIETSPDWLKNMAKEYDNNPYQRLVDMANIAKDNGAIIAFNLANSVSNSFFSFSISTFSNLANFANFISRIALA